MEQYVLLHVRDCRLAVPVEAVTAIEEPAAVAPVPFMPPYVEGLVAMRGQVLIQVNMRARLFTQVTDESPSGQLLVLGRKGYPPLALHVDRVGSMARPTVVAAPRRANCREIGLDDALGEGLVTGCFADEGGIAFVLDTSLLLPPDETAGMDDDDGIAADAPAFDDADTAEAEATAEDATPEDTPRERAIVIRVGDTLRALPIREAKEIVPLADIYRPPHAPEDLLGLVPVRERLVLVLSLKTLLGQREDGLSPKAVVMRAINMRYALAIDEVVGISSFAARTEIDGRGDCFLDDDGTPVSILSVDTLDEDRLGRALSPFLALTQTHDAQTTAVETRRLMTFRIGNEQCALELDRVRRVMPWRRPDDVPKEGTEDLDGVVNALGEVLPVLDLRGCLGHPAAGRVAAAAAYIVAEIDGAPWALSVDAIGRILTIPVTRVEPLGSRGPLAAVVRHDGDALWVISPERSLQARKAAGAADVAVA